MTRAEKLKLGAAFIFIDGVFILGLMWLSRMAVASHYLWSNLWFGNWKDSLSLGGVLLFTLVLLDSMLLNVYLTARSEGEELIRAKEMKKEYQAEIEALTKKLSSMSIDLAKIRWFVGRPSRGMERKLGSTDYFDYYSFVYGPFSKLGVNSHLSLKIIVSF